MAAVTAATLAVVAVGGARVGFGYSNHGFGSDGRLER